MSELAVRLQQRPIEADAVLQDKLRELAHGEVDVRYIGRATKQQRSWNTSRQRPLPIGCSVGHFAITAGTIGAFPTLRKTGKRVILSNNHVLANENREKSGIPSCSRARSMAAPGHRTPWARSPISCRSSKAEPT